MKKNILRSKFIKKFNLLPPMVLLIVFILIACGEKRKTSDGNKDFAISKSDSIPTSNNLSQSEIEEGWELLFDGKTTNGWRGYNKDSFPTKGWVIEDESIKVLGTGSGEAGGGGDIIYDKEFKDFELSLEWKISEGGNSGIFYLAEEIKGEPIYTSAPEMQVLDNERHPDAKLGKNGNRKAGSLYDLIAANPQNAKPVGEWNKISIIVYRGTVVHFQNGENVLEYHLWTDDWNDLVGKSKFKNWENFLTTGGKDKKGYIGLQDHGDDVWFRNIKIKKM